MPAAVNALREDVLVPGPKVLLMALLALPATIVGVSASPGPEFVSCLIAGAWFAVLPASMYSRKARHVLPFVAGALLIFALVALPFNSPAFVADVWTAAPMLVLALPRFLPSPVVPQWGPRDGMRASRLTTPIRSSSSKGFSRQPATSSAEAR
jgi:hypothetical protein